MQKIQGCIPAGVEAKKDMLQGIYALYSQWVERFPLVCVKGCAACCTGSVTMTSLEGKVIMAYIEEQGLEEWLHNRLANIPPAKQSRSLITTNQFAEACLARREVDENCFGWWDFAPCIFLENGICSMYAARPFGCRSFGSFVRCTRSRAAETTPVHLAVNTVFAQIIEHLDSDGGSWSTMTNILWFMINRENPGREEELLPAQPLPGFLLARNEMRVVHDLLRQLKKQFSGSRMFGDLIDNFLLI